MKACQVAFGVLLSGSLCQGFMPTPRLGSKFGALRSEPSDVESDADDDFLTIEPEDFVPTEAEETINNLMDLVSNSLGEISDSKRGVINEVILKLEALNPTEKPAYSSLVNGVWELRYAAGYSADGAFPSPTRQLALFMYSGGYSPGLFALNLAKQLPPSVLDVQDLEISINRIQPRVEATVKVKSLLGDSDIRVTCSLEAESDVRLRETYESATVMGNSIEIPEKLRYSRELYVTYVDEDIMILRDASGVPELLIRKEKDFSRQW
eukprot:CAMPEP_0176075314 /NCGR_PEP_ID=MMETSP0120_2-20121206/37643_1 /TAXON_ID=160619 /ORGANISM="Kryptoperidinium foliaceum, Strain CCMP 1326" /LENGTH=265 /DNA_ID=CAMNT_0017409019 /DNA_START=82 /DNA_END=876 /DNA_ORIENTATION=-